MDRIEIGEEEVYLKKDFFGWRVVEPVINPKTKKFVWKNFFSRKGMLTLAIIIILLLVGYLAVNEQIKNYTDVMENPCAYCEPSGGNLKIEDINKVNAIWEK